MIPLTSTNPTRHLPQLRQFDKRLVFQLADSGIFGLFIAAHIQCPSELSHIQRVKTNVIITHHNNWFDYSGILTCETRKINIRDVLMVCPKVTLAVAFVSIKGAISIAPPGDFRSRPSVQVIAFGAASVSDVLCFKEGGWERNSIRYLAAVES